MGAAGRIWSAAAHPRGPNGRFIKGGGGNSSSTPRPSRPGSAAAMFTAGAGKGRIHAATSRPPAAPARTATTAPNARPKPSKKLSGLTDQQLANGMQMHGNQSTTGRAIQVEAQRRKADAAKADRSLAAENVARSTGRHHGYDGLDPRELDVILGDNNVDTVGMSLEQKRAALAAHDKRIGAARFGGPSRTPDVAPSGSSQRTEISGWKSGRSPRRASAPLAADRVAHISALLGAAVSRDEARSHLNGLTASQLRQIAGTTGAVVGSNYTKAKVVDVLVDWTAGRRLDSAAIHRMANPKKSARRLMASG